MQTRDLEVGHAVAKAVDPHRAIDGFRTDDDFMPGTILRRQMARGEMRGIVPDRDGTLVCVIGLVRDAETHGESQRLAEWLK